MVVSLRPWIRKFMPQAIGMGMLPTHYLELSKLTWGKAYRKTEFLDDWREFSGLEKKRDPLRAIPRKLRPTEATIQETKYKQKQKFNYNYKIKGYDTIMETDIETSITVASDDLISIEEAENEALRLADDYKIDIEISEMLIDGVTVWRGA